MSVDSFKRRGGLKYAINEYKALQEFLNIGFLSKNEFIKAVFTRFPIRILPNFIRMYIYQTFLRN